MRRTHVRMRTVVMALCALAAAGPATAQQTVTLGVDDAVARALAHWPTPARGRARPMPRQPRGAPADAPR